MHKDIRVLAFVALALLRVNVFAQWIQTDGPYAGDVLCFGVNDTTLFACGEGGMYRSTSNGDRWAKVTEGLPYSSMAVVPVAEGASAPVILVGTVGSGIFRSTDNGTSWAASNQGLAELHVRSIVVSPNSDGEGGWNVFAGTMDDYFYGGGGVFKSTDGGMSWSAVNNGLTNVHVSLLGVFVPSGGQPGTTLFADTWDGLFRSSDDGASWVPAVQGLPQSTHIKSFAASGAAAFVGTASSGVFRSIDNGLSWSPASTGLPTDIGCLLVSGSSIYAGTASGIYRSTDNGDNWILTSIGLNNSHVFALAAARSAGGVGGTSLYAGTWGAGAFRSTNNGESWSAAGTGLAFASVYSLHAGAGVLFAGTPRAGVLSSLDGGATWNASGPGLDAEIVVAMTVSGTNLVAAIPSGIGGIHVSTNNGLSWTEASPGTVGAWCFASVGSDLFSGSDGVFKSTDRGLTWMPARLGLPKQSYGDSYESVKALASSGGSLFAGLNGQGVYRSTDSGANWYAANDGLMNPAFVSLLAPSAGGLIAVAGNNDGSALFITSDNGATWDVLNTSVTGYEVNSLIAYSPTGEAPGKDLFAGTHYGGVLMSADNGVSWTTVDEGLPRIYQPFRALSFMGQHLFVGTEGGGVWRRPLSEMITAVRSEHDPVPATYTLQQNYPNPFNPSTTIRYGLPSRSHVTLTVFNTLGQQVATLVQVEQEAGYHEAVFDASGLASGVYLYRLTAGSFVEIRKLVLVR